MEHTNMQTLKYVTELKNETEITSGSVEDTAHMRRAGALPAFHVISAGCRQRRERERKSARTRTTVR